MWVSELLLGVFCEIGWFAGDGLDVQMMSKGWSRAVRASRSASVVSGWAYGRRVSRKVVTSNWARSSAAKTGAETFW